MMTKARNPDIPRDVYPLSQRYPIDITESFGVSPLYQRLHWHELLEINLIESGSGYYIINGHTFEFQQGDILLINSNDLHRAYEHEGLHIKVYSFDRTWFFNDQHFDENILSPFNEIGIRYSNLLDRTNAKMELLRSILYSMEQEHKQKLTSYVSVVHAQLLYFLAIVAREFYSEAKLKGANGAYAKQLGKIREVISVMEEKYDQQWDLKSLSSLVYLSPSRFSVLFAKTVGVPPMDYLIRIRIAHAQNLLASTDRKVVDIALECGFRNLSNFNRQFKQLTGLSPNEIRKDSRIVSFDK